MKSVVRILLSCILMAAVLLSMAACSSKTDMEYVKSKGKIVVGVTDYSPYDYEEDGMWVGFDADMARELGKKLGVEVEFLSIDWEAKVTELKSKKIDLIWNGMTMTDELSEKLDFSYPYAQNSQVIVIDKKNANVFTSIESLKGSKVVAESGSAGESAALEAFGEENVIGIDSQAKALFEVKSGTVEAAVIDYSMAKSLCGSGDYADLRLIDDVRIGEELFAVGIRKGSDLVDAVNELLCESYKNGKTQELQEKYGKKDDGSNAIALYDLSDK